jgi:nucleoside-diphosphate-sugar epimerase
LNVLVTGGAGYIGSVLCARLLSAGYNVHVLDNLRYGPANLMHLVQHPDFQFTYGDARRRATVAPLVQPADVVVPLAAIVGAPACDADRSAAESTNEGAIDLLLQLLSPSQIVVYPNTNSGYGIKPGGEACTEDSPLNPISVYGHTKVNSEGRLLALAPLTVSLRLATVFGPSPRMRTDLLVNHFVYKAVTDGAITVYQKDYKRNFVHILDVADAFVYAIEHIDTMRGRAFNLGLDSANLSKAQLALKVKEQVPGFHINFAETGEDPDKRDYTVSNARLKAAGFEVHRTLESGIAGLIKAYRMLGRQPHVNA